MRELYKLIGLDKKTKEKEDIYIIAQSKDEALSEAKKFAIVNEQDPVFVTKLAKGWD